MARPRSTTARAAPSGVRVCTEVLERRRAEPAGRHGVLRAYAAQNPSEFFAVATEAFFVRPAALREDEPALYDVLRGFYGQDPARRLGAGGS